MNVLEMKRLSRFIQSPYHNSNQKIFQLFQLLKKVYPNYDKARLSREKIYKVLYKENKYNATKFQSLCSDLVLLIEDFLINDYLKKNNNYKKLILTETLKDKDYALYTQTSRRLISYLGKKKASKSAEDYFMLYHLHHQLWHHIETEKFKEIEKDINLAQANLDKLYQLEKLKYIAAISSRANFLNTPTAKALKDLEQKFLIKEIVEPENILLFKKVYGLHSSPNLTTYQNVKALILNSLSKLNIEDKRNLIIHLINFVINFRLKSDELHYREIFDLYQIGVTHNLFVVNGRMRDIEFINIGMAGFGVNEFDWTHHFITSHQAFLSEKDKEEAVPFVLAYGKLFKKEYEAVIDILRNVNPKENLKNHFRIKSLLIRAFFECILRDIGDYDIVMQHQLASFKKLMERDNKNAAIRTKAYLNFISIVKKMITYLSKNRKNKISISTLEVIINETKPLVLKVWLKEKIEDLKGATS